MKRVRSLGHHVALWAEALRVLKRRVESDRLPVLWRGHLLHGLAGVDADLPESMALKVLFPESDPAAWTVVSGPDETLAALGAPARALLHLPALRKTWAGWLRGSVLEDLRSRLGRAWIVDPTALPPQGALPGLGIARWEDFWRLAGSGRGFRVRFADGDIRALDVEAAEAEWRALADRLAKCALGGAVVEELPVKPGPVMAVAFDLKEGRWEMRE